VAAAKLLTAGLLGLLYGIAVQLASVAVAGLVLALRGVDLVPVDELARPLALGVLGVGVWALIGVGFGLLVRHQVVAVVTVVVVVFLLDPLLVLALGAVGEVGGVDLETVGSYLLTSASTRWSRASPAPGCCPGGAGCSCCWRGRGPSGRSPGAPRCAAT
jgi:hypothetical protein